MTNHPPTVSPNMREAFERLQAIIDWADLALSNPQEFNKHGVKNLDGPVFDAARELLSKNDTALATHHETPREVATDLDMLITSISNLTQKYEYGGYMWNSELMRLLKDAIQCQDVLKDGGVELDELAWKVTRSVWEDYKTTGGLGSYAAMDAVRNILRQALTATVQGDARGTCTLCGVETSSYDASASKWPAVYFTKKLPGKAQHVCQGCVNAAFAAQPVPAASPSEGVDRSVLVEIACKAYDNCVDELGDSAMLRYCNDVPMHAAVHAVLQPTSGPAGHQGTGEVLPNTANKAVDRSNAAGCSNPPSQPMPDAKTRAIWADEAMNQMTIEDTLQCLLNAAERWGMEKGGLPEDLFKACYQAAHVLDKADKTQPERGA